jgi:hypothetical protein
MGRPKKPPARKPPARKPPARKTKKKELTAQELDDAANLLGLDPQRDIVVI